MRASHITSSLASSLAVLAGLLVAGCTEAETSPDEDVEAPLPRLLVPHHRVAGNTLVGEAWLPYFDSERDEECVSTPWDDGALRCTPDASDLDVHGDAACTTPVALAPGYAATWAGGGPEGREMAGLHRVNPEPSWRTTYVLDETGACTPDVARLTYGLIEEVPRDALVTLTRERDVGTEVSVVRETTEDGTRRAIGMMLPGCHKLCAGLGAFINADHVICEPRLDCDEDLADVVELPRIPAGYGERVLTVLVDGGGVFMPDGMHDTVIDSDCWPQLAEDGELRCLPATYNLVVSAFLDPACAQPVDVILGISVEAEILPYAPSRFASGIVGAGDLSPGDSTFEIVELGERIEGAVYEVVGDACVASSYPFHALGPRVPPETFAPVETVFR